MVWLLRAVATLSEEPGLACRTHMVVDSPLNSTPRTSDVFLGMLQTSAHMWCTDMYTDMHMQKNLESHIHTTTLLESIGVALKWL